MGRVSGSIAQSVEQSPFKGKVVGSMPSGPTKNMLITKLCGKCSKPIYVSIKGEDVSFIGCKPTLVDIKIVFNGTETIIKAKRSTEAVRCEDCNRKNLLRSFKEITDGNR